MPQPANPISPIPQEQNRKKISREKPVKPNSIEQNQFVIPTKVNDVTFCSFESITIITKLLATMPAYGCIIKDKKYY